MDEDAVDRRWPCLEFWVMVSVLELELMLEVREFWVERLGRMAGGFVFVVGLSEVNERSSVSGEGFESPEMIGWVGVLSARYGWRRLMKFSCQSWRLRFWYVEEKWHVAGVLMPLLRPRACRNVFKSTQ